MSESKTTDIKEMADKASDFAKNIWLAGLGAYGKTVDEAQGAYQKVTDKVKEASESTKLFDDLVEKGKKLETDTQEKLSEVREKANVNLEDRLAKVKESMSLSLKNPFISTDDKLEEIAEKLDQILAALEKQATPPTATKSTAAKTTTRKTTTRKTAASKSA